MVNVVVVVVGGGGGDGRRVVMAVHTGRKTEWRERSMHAYTPPRLSAHDGRFRAIRWAFLVVGCFDMRLCGCLDA